jgi:hypothetical protein
VAIHRNEFPTTFADDGSVVVNFGILTGREATQAELDRLALALRQAGAGAEMTITAERRQEYSPGIEGVVHQVRVTLAGSPTHSVEAICDAWALSCAEDRTVEPLDEIRETGSPRYRWSNQPSRWQRYRRPPREPV